MSGLDGVEYHAVVYGINTYANMRNLNNAANDGADMKTLLEAQGYQVHNINIGPAVNRDEVIADLAALESIVDSNDILLFYFAGHGGPVPGSDEAFIAFTNSTASDSNGDGVFDSVNLSKVIRTSELTSAMDAVGALHNIVILDSCNSGGFISGDYGIDQLPDDKTYPTNLNPDENRNFSDSIGNYFSHHGNANYTLISSGGFAEPVPDGWSIPFQEDWGLPDTADFRNNGVFTSVFMLSSVRADANGDSYITASEAYSYTRKTIDRTYNRFWIRQLSIFTATDMLFSAHISGGGIDPVLFRVP
jgi:hypothetical protein